MRQKSLQTPHHQGSLSPLGAQLRVRPISALVSTTRGTPSSRVIGKSADEGQTRITLMGSEESGWVPMGSEATNTPVTHTKAR